MNNSDVMKNSDVEFLWILSPTGKIFIQRVFDRKLTRFDEEMFSNLLTTISLVSSKFFNSNVETIQLGGKVILTKVYPDFQVILSVKKSLEDKNIYDLVEEVAEAFRIEYSDLLKEQIDIDIHNFDKFGAIIDMIFGLKTYIYVEEQEKLLKILDEAIAKEFNEQQTIKVILDFLDTLDHYKLDILINNIGENIKPILENAKGISELQKKRYSRLLSI